MERTWSSLLIVTLFAAVTIVSIDHLADSVVPPVNRREAEDGIQDLKNANPDILVLGSSHARTLHVVGQELAQRTNGRRTLVAVPLENGKLVAYDWLLKHRLAPLLEEQRVDGVLVRDRIKEFVLITEWWDSCAPAERETFNYWNLPSRAWDFDTFAQDILHSGLNGYNRNYLQNKMRRLLNDSALLFNRTNQQLIPETTALIQGLPRGMTPELYQTRLAGWIKTVESGISCIGNPTQLNALRDIVEYAKGRGMKVTILLFPRKPGTITPKAEATTIRTYSTLVKSFAASEDVEVVDMTTSTPLTDDDFMEDFDHVNAAGNVKFSHWALDHGLHFLLDGKQLTAQASIGLAP